MPVRLALPSGRKSVDTVHLLVPGEAEGRAAGWSRTLDRPAVFRAGAPFRLSHSCTPATAPRAVPTVEKRRDGQVGRHLTPERPLGPETGGLMPHL